MSRDYWTGAPAAPKATKRRKMAWLKHARKNYESGTLFTCNCFVYPIGHPREFDGAITWYQEVTCAITGTEAPLSPDVFDGDPPALAGNQSAREHRKMWLAMLQTLVEAGEI